MQTFKHFFTEGEITINKMRKYKLTTAGEIHGVSDGVVSVYAQRNQNECG